MSTGINIGKSIKVLEEGVSITNNVSQLDFTGAGVTASTVGDNVTVNVPGSIGATAFYMNESIAQAPYKEFSSAPTSAAEQIVPATIAGGVTVTVAAYQTPSGIPNTTVIPAGLWQFFLHFNAGAAGQNWIIRPKVYKRDLGGIETLIFTPDPEIVTNMSTTTTMYTCDGVFPNTTLLTTDRIVVKIDLENTTGVSQTANFKTEGSQHYSVATTTLNQVVPGGTVTNVTGTAPIASSGGTTPAISIANAVADGSTKGAASFTASDFNSSSGNISIDYTNGQAASSSDKGFLTSADWTTFNNKVSSVGATAPLTSSGGTTPSISTSMATNKLIGRSTAGTGVMEEITVGTGLTLSAGTLSAAASSGVWGISNASGVYTYYATLTLAMAAASSGTTIELFADVTETGSTSVSLKPGVTISGNGHTYTHTNATNNTFDLTTTGTYTFLNFNIKRTVTAPVAGAVIFGNVGAGFYQVYSLILKGGYIEYNWTVTSGNLGGLYASTNVCTYNFDGINISSNSNSYISSVNGIIRNSTFENTGTGGCISTDNAVISLENLYLKTVSGNCLFMNYGAQSIRNSTAITTSGLGIAGQSGASAYDCYAFSNTGKAFSGVTAFGCTGQTSTGNAYYQCNTFTCNGRSTTGYTIVPFFTLSDHYTGAFYSSGASVAYSTGYSASFYNSSIITDSGNAIAVAGSPVIVNNFIKAGSAANYCISTGAITVKYSGNQFSTATTPVTPATIQGIINTSDNQGNILI